MILRGSIERCTATDAEIRDDDHVALPRIVFAFDRHKWAMLRQLIDRLNESSPDVSR